VSPRKDDPSPGDDNPLLHRMREEAKNALPPAGTDDEEPPVDHRKMRYPPGMVDYDEDLDATER